ncbi:MAG: AAA family ATPase [Ruminococcaceae bacterium]|nr:AAA family ATPase [Oscillospiraceae bacterium]
MNFDGLIGNNGIKKTLERPFHAYIIHGPKGSGKHTLAKILTASFVCESKEKPCGKCNQCKKYLSGNHVDITYCPTDIKVKELRESLKDASYLPNDAEHRVFIFDDADKLSVVCQNALLKIIEEPPKHAIFIFITENIKSILQTVRSRCEALAMEPLEEKELIQYLQRPEFSRISEEKKAAAIAFSGGYLGVAKDFLSDEKTELYRRCDEFATALAKKRPAELLRTVSFKKREDLVEFSAELYGYFTVHLRSLKSGSTVGLNADVRALGPKRLISICTRLDKINENIRFNVNTSLFSTLIVSECYSACWRYS